MPHSNLLKSSQLVTARPIPLEYGASTVDEVAKNPASVQPVETADARLLARTIPQEYDASKVELVV